MFDPFFKPQVDVTCAGSPAIEREIVTEVASFGTQIGLLTEAVLLLAEGNDAEPIRDLHAVQAKVAAVKRRRRESAEAEARKALDALDKATRERLLRSYAG